MIIDIIAQAYEQGHLAVRKTMEQIQQQYFRKKLQKKVETFIGNWVTCLLASRKQGQQDGFLNPIDKGKSPLISIAHAAFRSYWSFSLYA